MTGNKPTHILKMKSKNPDDKRTSNIGVAWLKGKNLSLYLNMGVVLSWEDFRDNLVTLFPNTPHPDYVKNKKTTGGAVTEPDWDDKIPF